MEVEFVYKFHKGRMMHDANDNTTNELKFTSKPKVSENKYIEHLIQKVCSKLFK